ncbi:MAG: phosphoenolpyruvate--protein phosphotransferase [Candidatus Cloacimonetes bacterium]|nr:phosphoenolpyruvate--protein phosphotransferase [Candidatus Cloacimonadota bacterium]
MKILSGIAVSPGIGIGHAKIIKQKLIEIDKHSIEQEDIHKEVERFEKSLIHVINDIDKLIDNYSNNKNNKQILTTHKMMLEDPELIDRIKELISKELMSLEKAIDFHFNEIVAFFNKMDNEYMSERSSDYQDLAYRLLAHVTDQKEDCLDDLDEDSILLMSDITPSKLTRIFKQHISGLCTEKGSKTSHSSIIARSMSLPTVVGIDHVVEQAKQGEIVIVDGNEGKIILDPDEKTLIYYREIWKKEEQKKIELQEIIDVVAKTKDGKRIKLKCNIEIPEELEQIASLNSDGIGLMRTEFLFIDKDELPDEDEQYQIYKEIANKMKPQQVIIRTIDVGGDKLSNILNISKEVNPNLGCRGVRISLRDQENFKIQIKAILRANEFGNVAVMFPMISNVNEIRKLKSIIEECQAELSEAGVAINSVIKIGVMIEIPSAAINSDIFSKECDFFSIGTNDLVQYTLAVDRGNQLVADYYQPTNPAVLRLLNMTIVNGHEQNLSISVCGEMASEDNYIKLLIGLGVDELSVSPGRYLAVKEKILNCDYSKAKELAANVLGLASSNEIEEMLLKKN